MTHAPADRRDAEPLQRAFDVVAERWTLRIIDLALNEDITQFNDFRNILGIQPDVLTTRLRGLVQAEILTRQAYKAAGSRTRWEYLPTAAGRDLGATLNALSGWAQTYMTEPPDLSLNSDGGGGA